MWLLRKDVLSQVRAPRSVFQSGVLLGAVAGYRLIKQLTCLVKPFRLVVVGNCWSCLFVNRYNMDLQV